MLETRQDVVGAIAAQSPIFPATVGKAIANPIERLSRVVALYPG